MPSKSSGPTSGANSTQSEETTEATASPYDLVRVRSAKSGNEHTVTRVMAEQSEDLKVLDGKPAVDAIGKPLPARPKPTNRTDKAGTPAQEA